MLYCLKSNSRDLVLIVPVVFAGFDSGPDEKERALLEDETKTPGRRAAEEGGGDGEEEKVGLRYYR